MKGHLSCVRLLLRGNLKAIAATRFFSSSLDPRFFFCYVNEWEVRRETKRVHYNSGECVKKPNVMNYGQCSCMKDQSLHFACCWYAHYIQTANNAMLSARHSNVPGSWPSGVMLALLLSLCYSGSNPGRID